MPNADGVWRGLHTHAGYRRGYRDKVFWWTFTVSPATNAYHEDFGGWAMLAGVDIPTARCWELTGRYGEETLSFVVWVVP